MYIHHICTCSDVGVRDQKNTNASKTEKDSIKNKNESKNKILSLAGLGWAGRRAGGLGLHQLRLRVAGFSTPEDSEC